MQELFSGTTSFELAQPWWLFLLLLLPVLRRVERRLEKSRKRMVFPRVGSLKAEGLAAGTWLSLPRWLTLAAVVLALLAVARPRVSLESTDASARGIDIMLALDISDSMLEDDFNGASRLDAAKSVALRFIKAHPRDRIGLVLFRGKSFTQCPLTTDHDILAMLLREVSADMISDDGTALGSAVLVATNRLRASVSGEKVMVLLTDGVNNSGEVGPLTAAGIAADRGVRIYVVGIGTEGDPEMPEEGSGLSPESGKELLERIADRAGGRFFAAADNDALLETFTEIEALERTRLDGPVRIEHRELYPLLLLLAAFFLATGLAAGNTRMLRIP